MVFSPLLYAHIISFLSGAYFVLHCKSFEISTDKGKPTLQQKKTISRQFLAEGEVSY